MREGAKSKKVNVFKKKGRKDVGRRPYVKSEAVI